MRKFTIVGTHSTGKSTLVKKLSERFPDLHVTDSVTRKATTKEERRLETVSDTVQRKILEKIIEGEKELLEISKTQDILMDRSYLDFTAYTEVFYDFGYITEDFMNEVVDGAALRLTKGLPFSYDVLFYLPIEFEVVDDGVRNTDEELRRKVDDKLREYLISANEFTKVVMVSGTLEERIKIIENEIRSYHI